MKSAKILFMIALILGTAAPLMAEQIVTGEVVSVNHEARAVAIQQQDPATGTPKTLYLASVMDKDLIDTESFEELEVGQTISVRVTDIHHLSTTPLAALADQVTQIEKKTKEGDGLLEDVEDSSISIP
jgi:hypothetical protein